MPRPTARGGLVVADLTKRGVVGGLGLQSDTGRPGSKTPSEEVRANNIEAPSKEIGAHNTKAPLRGCP